MCGTLLTSANDDGVRCYGFELDCLSFGKGYYQIWRFTLEWLKTIHILVVIEKTHRLSQNLTAVKTNGDFCIRK